MSTIKPVSSMPLEIGERYQIRLKGKKRFLVLDYIGSGNGKLNFSARPKAGTQTIREGDIQEATKVVKTVPIKI